MEIDALNALYAREIVATRIIPAPRAAVWAAWADPQVLSRWWGPHGFRNTTHAFDFRPGGEWRLTMHGPDGEEYPNVLAFRVIAEPETIMLEHLSTPEFLLTGQFDDLGARTKVTFRQLFFESGVCLAVKPVCLPANEENLDRLSAILAEAG